MADDAVKPQRLSDQGDLCRHLVELTIAAWRDLDDAGGVGWPDRFTLDGVFDFHGRLTQGRDALRVHFDKRTEGGPRTSAHLLSNLSCVIDSPSSARVRADICVFGADGPAPQPMGLPTLIGPVEDLFVREDDGVWRIARRAFRARFYNPQDRIGARIAGG